MQEIYTQTRTQTGVSTNRVLKNTYMLLAMTMGVSAVACAISMAIGLGHGVALMMNLAAIGIVWFVLPKTANSASGIYVVFGFTALLGASLGPTINHYLQMTNGSQIVMQALAGTALVFFGLSGYVLTTKKDFSFMRGFLVTGLIVVVLCALALVVAGFFGVNIAGVHLALSAAIVFLMSGFILYDTSRIINGGETNYVMATVSLYLNIYNLFVSLLHLIGATSND
ncbi:Bax inhibitor-1/YccA family protein [Aestuariicella hydrocarbonica]|uniref:Bax inhibitor-1/YccA family protein n=1 Tax=Pseudomaricurvus hydrocarbonicus TaxID=1470433 RepID=A0A9E5MGX8_9GAMM|nr:Bax inhibitor-1/YccA family protein [Aestuariicella hydrocarbonica]NHO65271.1 Bax inhibitor-1/YccA family protein [Aestuariicella hydrocarbonica]